MFATSEMLTTLQNSNYRFVDGTFRTAPRPYKQLLTIHGFYHGFVVRLLFCCMRGKSVVPSGEIKHFLYQLHALTICLNLSKCFKEFVSLNIKLLLTCFMCYFKHVCHFWLGINSIVQGSGIGPMLYAVMESDLHTLSPKNIVVKYADDTNVFVPADSDIGLLQEFNRVNQWDEDNKMVINLLITERDFHYTQTFSETSSDWDWQRRIDGIGIERSSSVS